VTGWAWIAVAGVLIGAGFALLALARRRTRRPEGDGAGEVIPGLLGLSEAPPLFEPGEKPPGYRPGQQEDPP
jgi:hypothetical protein